MPPTVILLLEMNMVMVHLLHPFGLILRSPLRLSLVIDLLFNKISKLFNLILLLLYDPLILLFFLVVDALRQLIKAVTATHQLPLVLKVHELGLKVVLFLLILELTGLHDDEKGLFLL